MRVYKLSILLILLVFNICYGSTTKSNILIVYYSRSGHTQIMAEAVAEGAGKNENVNVKILSVEDVKITDVIESDAIIIGSPVYNA
ncbi:flavodoxin domain-containing protein, partial [Calditrichota bacterium]